MVAPDPQAEFQLTHDAIFGLEVSQDQNWGQDVPHHVTAPAVVVCDAIIFKIKEKINKFLISWLHPR